MLRGGFESAQLNAPRATLGNDTQTSILPADWRMAGDTVPPPPPTATAPAKAAPKSKLHIAARKGNAAQERERAVDIIDAARSEVTSAFADIRDGRPIPIESLTPVVEAIAASVLRDPSAIPGVTRLKDRHEYTYLHSIAVCGLMVCLAHELELDQALIHEIGVAGLLHDIGKARIPNLLLDKPGPLTTKEFALVKSHTDRGHELLLQSGIDSPIVLDVCLHHHERIDGRGYPAMLSGERLSLYARMGAVCDVFDAVTSARAYKNAWAAGEAIAWMNETEGQFDRRVLTAFTHLIGPLSDGTLVRLQSDRLALIVAQGSAIDPHLAIVAFHHAATRKPIALTVIDEGLDPIVGIERPSRWHFDDWPRTRGGILEYVATLSL